MRGEGRTGANSPPGILALVMCRVFGCVAAEPVSIRHELLEAENPIIRQSEDHDSGWGMVYERPEGREPGARALRGGRPHGPRLYATNMRGRIFNVHVRRATMGDLAPENTHPFQLGSNTFGHNGTIIRYPRLLEPGMRRPSGDTDSEHLFNLLMHDYDPGDPVESLRRTIRTAVERSPFSGLNLLFSDGERLLAYRLGMFELHWLPRPGQLLVASEKVTEEPWHTVQQDVVLVLDPNDLEEPHAERLIGDELVARAEIQRVDHSPHLRGAARGAAAAERARAAARRLPSEPPLRAAGQPGLRGRQGAAGASGGARGARPPRGAPPDGDHAQHRACGRGGQPRCPTRRGRAGPQRRRPPAPLAGALKGTDAALALVPCGRGNDFARVLEIPDDPAAAARVAVEGSERLLDVADLDGTPFVGIASFGFDSDANRIANNARVIKGDAVYFYARCARSPSGGPRTSRCGRRAARGGGLLGGGRQLEGIWGRHVRVAQADLDDGKLDVMLCTDVSKRTFLRDLPKVFKGTHLDLPYVRSLRGSVIEVASDRPFVIYADGDPIGATPATVRVESRCLRVVVPT